MKTIQEILSQIQSRTMTHQKSCTREPLKDSTQTLQSDFECDICKDTEQIVKIVPGSKIIRANGEEEVLPMAISTPCSCVEGKKYRKILENSGISEAFQSKTVNEYKPKNEQQSHAKAAAIDYIKNFDNIRVQRENSIALLGQVGSGKTHLTIAIANALLKNGVGVRYMQYREVLTQLKQCKFDEENYQREISKYKNAPVLLIDDLFKGATRQGQINESEMDIMFEIVNHRYLKQLPILVSSEYTSRKLVDFEESIGSRIAHMCKGRTIELYGPELNHRMV